MRYFRRIGVSLFHLSDAVHSKPVQLRNNQDDYLVTAVKHRKSFTIRGLSPFFWLANFFLMQNDYVLI